MSCRRTRLVCMFLKLAGWHKTGWFLWGLKFCLCLSAILTTLLFITNLLWHHLQYLLLNLYASVWTNSFVCRKNDENSFLFGDFLFKIILTDLTNAWNIPVTQSPISIGCWGFMRHKNRLCLNCRRLIRIFRFVSKKVSKNVNAGIVR